MIVSVSKKYKNDSSKTGGSDSLGSPDKNTYQPDTLGQTRDFYSPKVNDRPMKQDNPERSDSLEPQCLNQEAVVESKTITQPQTIYTHLTQANVQRRIKPISKKGEAACTPVLNVPRSLSSKIHGLGKSRLNRQPQTSQCKQKQQIQPETTILSGMREEHHKQGIRLTKSTRQRGSL